MSNRSESICIVCTDTKVGADLRELVLATGHEYCAVVSSIDCIESLSDKNAIVAVLMHRATPVASLDQRSGFFEHCPVVTFGDTNIGQESPNELESRALFQLNHPAGAAELARLFSEIDQDRNSKRPNEAFRPLQLYRGLVGKSEVVADLKSVIDRVSPTNGNILVLGETGTGKEVVARNIHYRSKNSGGPFIPVNCSAIPADLLESELFGHKKGAFTGAVSDRKGRFELASGGTLFLDEIGDMPLLLQVKLLRVLEERKIYRLGGNSAIPMTARLIAATHRDLEERVASGDFREDLYYRLNVIPLQVPPLRDRKDDIPDLIRELSFRRKNEPQVSIEFSDAAIHCLKSYNWPGNIRELANLIERLTVLHPDGRIEVENLPAEIRGVEEFQEEPTITELDLVDGFDLREYLKSTETQLIRQALDCSGGVVTRAAELLHVRRTTLTEKVRRLGLSDMIKQAS